MYQFPKSIPLGPFRICKFATGINDTIGKFATGINNTSGIGGKFATGVIDRCS